MNVTAYSLKNKTATFVMVLGFVVLGIYGYFNMPVNFLPDITYPVIKVNIDWPGATPEEIDINIAKPLEKIVATVDGLDYLESSSIEGRYSLTVNFQYNTDINAAYQDVLATVARANKQLPENVESPVIFKADPSSLPVAQITVTSDKMDLVKLRDWAENQLEHKIIAIPGVAGTEVVGGLKREIRVLISPETIEKYAIALPVIINKLSADNTEQFGGRVTQGGQEFITRTMGEYKNLDEIKSTVIIQNGINKVLLSDLAEVVDSHEDARLLTRLDGKAAVKINVLKQADANTVEVARLVDAKLKELRDGIPADIKLGVVENQAVYVESSLNSVKSSALEAALLVVGIIFIFLGSWRQAAIMIIILPLTLIINFALMKICNYSLNIFSLGGLVVAIGVVLDNSTVVIENCTRLRQANQNAPLREIILESVDEVKTSLLAGTFSFLALFLPFLFVPGLTTLLYRELIFVIAGLVLISLAIALTLTPALADMIMTKYASSNAAGRFDAFFGKIVDIYGQILRYILTIKKRLIIISSGALLLSFFAFSFLGTEFLPVIDDGRVTIKLRMPTGTAISETEKIILQLETLVQDEPAIESYFTMIGGRSAGQSTLEIANEGEINIQLLPGDKRKIGTKKYIEQLRENIKKISIPGAKITVAPQKIKGIKKTGDNDIEIKIRGENLEQLFSIAQNALKAMQESSSLTNTNISLDLSKPEYQVLIDRVKAADLGIDTKSLAQNINAMINGAIATEYREQGEYYNVRLMLADQYLKSTRHVENMLLNTDREAYIRVKDVAQVKQAVGPVEITKENQVRQIIVRADANKISVGEAVKSVQKVLSGLELPPGYEISMGGQAQMMSEMARTISMVLAFAVFFAFIVLCVQFNSLKLPVLILSGIPFCIPGMVFALLITNFAVGSTVVIGALIVISATISEGVLLLTFAEELKQKKNLSSYEAVVNASQTRLRPRLMITLATTAGLVPLALNLNTGGEMLQPMAVAAIGGLLMSIAVSLFLVPCFYCMCSTKTT